MSGNSKAAPANGFGTQFEASGRGALWWAVAIAVFLLLLFSLFSCAGCMSHKETAPVPTPSTTVTINQGVQASAPAAPPTPAASPLAPIENIAREIPAVYGDAMRHQGERMGSCNSISTMGTLCHVEQCSGLISQAAGSPPGRIKLTPGQYSGEYSKMRFLLGDGRVVEQSAFDPFPSNIHDFEVCVYAPREVAYQLVP